jgi:hypothetical protein
MQQHNFNQLLRLARRGHPAATGLRNFRTFRQRLCKTLHYFTVCLEGSDPSVAGSLADDIAAVEAPSVQTIKDAAPTMTILCLRTCRPDRYSR